MRIGNPPAPLPRARGFLQALAASQASPTPPAPPNLYLHGSLDQVKASFQQAGWTLAADNNQANDVRYLESVPVEGGFQLFKTIREELDKIWDWLKGKRDIEPQTDPVKPVIDSMPLSDQTLDGRSSTLEFERDNNPVGGRHHCRLFEQGQRVWAIAASQDVGIKIDPGRPEQLFLNHAIAPNTDPERDLILRNLQAAGAVAMQETLTLGYGNVPAPASGALPVDGKVYDVHLAR